VMFHETFFNKGPESFNPVDVHLSLFELDWWSILR
jgi:hypothetical protein